MCVKKLLNLVLKLYYKFTFSVFNLFSDFLPAATQAKTVIIRSP